MSEQATNKHQSLGSVISSVLAAFIGVQSDRKRQEDFTRGKISTYVIVGLAGTALFVGTIIGIVMLVMHLAIP